MYFMCFILHGLCVRKLCIHGTCPTKQLGKRLFAAFYSVLRQPHNRRTNARSDCEFQLSLVGEPEVGQRRGCCHPGLVQVTSLSQVLVLWWAGKGKLSISTH